MRIRFRTAFWSGAAVLVVVLLGFAFRPQPVAVDAADVQRGPMQVTVRDEGRTRVRDEFVVSAPVAGRLLRVPFKAGAHVRAGDTVARIEPGAPAFLDRRALAEARAAAESAAAAVDAALAEAERAEEQLRFARTELERAERLRERDLTSTEVVDRARLELRSAESTHAAAIQSVRMREAELEAAQSRLMQPGADAAEGDAVDVSAPVSGRVLRVMQESESIVAAGAEIMSLGDPNELEVVVEMLSTEAVRISPGDEVVIDNFGDAERSLEGRVRYVEPYGFVKVSALGVEEQRVNVIVDFEAPPEEWAALGHGYRVQAAVVVWQDDDVVRVPVAALFRSSGQWAVFRVESGTARLTPVEIGRDNGRDAQVVSGLEARETVILYPGEQVGDGARVRVRGGET